MSEAGHSLSVEDYNEITQLYGFYARDVDPGSVRNASWMFTDDGVFRNLAVAEMTHAGKEALHRFYEQVRDEQSAGVRHFNSTYVIVGTAEGARSSGYMFTAERLEPGGPPILSDFGKYEDRLVKTDEGWRFKERIWFSDTYRGDTAEVLPSPIGEDS